MDLAQFYFEPYVLMGEMEAAEMYHGRGGASGEGEGRRACMMLSLVPNKKT